MRLYGEIKSEEIIDRTGAQTLFYVTCTTISSVELVQYGVSRGDLLGICGLLYKKIGWIDGLIAIYVLFNSVSVISGRCETAVCNGAPFMVEKISPRAGIELGPLDQ